MSLEISLFGITGEGKMVPVNIMLLLCSLVHIAYTAFYIPREASRPWKQLGGFLLVLLAVAMVEIILLNSASLFIWVAITVLLGSIAWRWGWKMHEQQIAEKIKGWIVLLTGAAISLVTWLFFIPALVSTLNSTEVINIGLFIIFIISMMIYISATVNRLDFDEYGRRLLRWLGGLTFWISFNLLVFPDGRQLSFWIHVLGAAVFTILMNYISQSFINEMEQSKERNKKR